MNFIFSLKPAWNDVDIWRSREKLITNYSKASCFYFKNFIIKLMDLFPNKFQNVLQQLPIINFSKIPMYLQRWSILRFSLFIVRCIGIFKETLEIRRTMVECFNDSRLTLNVHWKLRLKYLAIFSWEFFIRCSSSFVKWECQDSIVHEAFAM